MTLVKNNEREIPKTFSDMLDHFFAEANLTDGRGFRPVIDLSETNKAYEVDVMLPGLEKSQISLEVTGQGLRVSGKRETTHQENDRTYHLKESPTGSFERSIEIPEDGNLEKVEAKFDNGILHITVPKAEKSSGKQIHVR
jgi:HSP20 family protein